MKASLRVFSFSVLASVTALAASAQTPTPNQPPAQQPGAANSVWSAPPTVGAVSTTPSACGNQPLCYDTPDFAVAVVDFRMSLTNGMKVMDATLRFLNKTNQPLILGYLDGSGMALDDQGNRYATYYNKGLAGIGLVVGNSMDPKFTLQPSGAGDARFELYWRPGAQDPIGSTFEFDATIREINTLVGGQHTLGGEFPLRFQGLMNGMNGAAPSGVAAAASGGAGVPATGGANPMLASAGGTSMPVCGSTGSASGTINAVAGAASSVGGQQATNAASAASAKASSAVSQLSSLKSLFGKKNAAAANTAGAPCVPAPATTAQAPAATTPTPTPAPAQVVNTSAAAPNSKAPATATGTTQGTAASPSAMKAGAPVTARKTAAPPISAGSAAAPSATTAPKPAATANTAASTKPTPKPTTNAASKKPATTTANQTPAQQTAQQPK